MKRNFIIISLFLSFHLFGQEFKIEFDSKTPLIADQFIGYDELDNIFYIQNNILFRENSTETINYSNVKLGQLYSVNIQNPFKIILFYKDYNAIVILDNKLNELSSVIDFTRQTTFNNVLFISPSSQNNIWLLADDNKLHLYDYKNNLDQFETQAISFYQKNFTPTATQSTYKYIWVFSKNVAIQFNEYGSFIASSKLADYDNIQAYQNGYLYLKGRSLFFLKNQKEELVSNDMSQSIINFFTHKSNFYTFNGTHLTRYNILE